MKISNITPVLPTKDIAQEMEFFQNLGFINSYDSLQYASNLDYVVMTIDSQSVHLQLFADGNFMGQQVKVWVEDISDVQPIFSAAGIAFNFQENTPWRTNELACYSPSKHTIIFVQDLDKA